MGYSKRNLGDVTDCRFTVIMRNVQLLKFTSDLTPAHPSDSVSWVVAISFDESMPRLSRPQRVQEFRASLASQDG